MLRGHTFIDGFSQESSNYIRAGKRLRVSAYLSAGFLLIFIGLAAFPVASSISNTNAAKKDLNTTTLSMSSSSFYANTKVASATGTFSSSSTEISVSTDNYTGYSIGIAAKNDDADYSKLKSVDSELDSISSATSEEDFSSASGTSYNGLWGYKPSMLASEANSNFLPAPTFEGSELNRTNSANEQADTYTISLGARADGATPYGRYKNTFVLRTVANPIGIVFAYHGNTEDTVTNMPTTISASLSDEKIVVSETEPERSGYDFVGWCDGSTRTILGVDYCDSDEYDGGDDYWLDRSGMTVEVNLYAMWKPTGASDYICNSNATTISEAVCMQDMNASVKASMVAEQQYKLFDSRDNKTYYVAKLNDGNVWMTQDLEIELSSSTALTHADTDLGWNEFDTNVSWTPSRSTVYSGSAWVNDSTASYPQSYKGEDRYYNSSNSNMNDKSYTSIDECAQISGSKEGCEHRKDGARYNWLAATASNESVVSGDYDVASNSICPAGWRLPYGERDFADSDLRASEYTRLLYTYGFLPDITSSSAGGRQDSLIAQMSGDPLYLIRGGYIYSEEGMKYVGNEGVYQTGTTMNNNVYTFMYQKSDSSSNSGWIYAATTWSKSSGMAIRCVARDEVTITFEANGGEGTMSPVTLYGDAHLPANQFTKANQSFVGWNTEPDGSGDYYGPEYTDTEYYVLRGSLRNVTLYAQWKNKTVISYDGNGADSGSVETQYVDYKQEIFIAANGFVRDGYAFYGWNTEADGSGTDYQQGDKFTAEEIEGENITLYAKWRQARIHTMNYNTSAGTSVVKYACSGGNYQVTKYSHTENVDDTGKQLGNYGGNWTEANIEGTDRGDKSKAHVVTIPGATSINVTIYYNGQGNSYDWVSVWSGRHPEYTAYNNYNSADYVWQKLGGSGSSNPTVNGNTLNRVNYTSTTIYSDSVTFGFRSNSSSYGNGYGYYAIITGTANDFSCEVSEGTYPDVADTETGAFTGWSTSSNASTASYITEQDVIKNYMKTRDANNYTTHTLNAVYGKWTTITYDANNGTGDTSVQRIAYPRSTTLDKNTFTREGYEFNAWNTESDGSGTYYEDEQAYTATVAAGTSFTLYAQWSEKNEYTVNYHNGENVNTVKYNCWDGRYSNKQVSSSPNVDSTGTQTGDLNRYYNQNKVIKFPNATKLHVKLTYGTTSINNAFTVIWAGDVSSSYDAYSYASQGVKFGDNTTGKYGGRGENGENFIIEGDIAGDTLTVGFFNTYNNTNYANGYGYYLEVTAGRDAMLCESEPVEGQYVAPVGDENDVFTGWSFDNNASLGNYMNELEAKSSLTTANTTVDMYAIWAKPTVLKFDNNGGSGTMNDIIIKYGESAKIPSNAFTNGEKVAFKNWNTEADGSGTNYSANNTYNATSPIGGDITLYAVWVMPLVVHFDANGGTGEMPDMLVGYNEDIIVPGSQFTRPNCVFWKYTINQDGTGRNYWPGNNLRYYDFSSDEDHQITLYAVWGVGTTFEFDANGGVGEMEPFSILYNTTAPLPPNEFTNEGYTFAYWNTKPDNSGTRYENEQSLTMNSYSGEDHIILYAIWGNPTNLIYDGNGADSGSMESVVLNYGDSITLAANQYVKNGYEFIGWSTSQNGIGISYTDQGNYVALDKDGGDHRLYAIWGIYKMDVDSHNSDNDDPTLDPESNTTPGSGAVTLARAYEIYYSAQGKGMYVPHKDPNTGEYDGTYFEATQASDYEGIPAADLRFAMQDMNSSICNSVTVYDERYDKVIDLRDYKSYYISKLRDGRCWMTQNLDLDIETTPDKVAALTSENTDIVYYNTDANSDYYHNGYSYDSTTGVITWHPNADTITKAYQEDVTISGWGTDEKTTLASLDIGDTVFYSDYDPLYTGKRISYSSVNECLLAGKYKNRCRHLQSGNYYNFAAQMANNQSGVPELYYDFNEHLNTYDAPVAQNSICPKGWTIPEDMDWYNTIQLYDDERNGDSYKHWFHSPLYLSRAGMIEDGKLQHRRYSDSSYAYAEVFFRTNRVWHNINTIRWTEGFGSWFYIDNDGHGSSGNYGSHSFDFGQGAPIRCVAR